MKWIIVYLVVALLLAAVCGVCLTAFGGTALRTDHLLLGQSTLVGMVAGVLYCLRAVYVNSGLDRWDSNWTVWYYLRPVTSAISGFASCIFLQAGLLALSSEPKPDAVPYGYYAVAFIAGYNVDFFMKKIEHVAQELWGIERSRASQEKSKTDSETPGQEDTK